MNIILYQKKKKKISNTTQNDFLVPAISNTLSTRKLRFS